jgi:hypothetical protein
MRPICLCGVLPLNIRRAETSTDKEVDTAVF